MIDNQMMDRVRERMLANKAREEKQQVDRTNGTGSKANYKPYDQIEYLNLEDKKATKFRFIGKGPEYRTENWEAKFLLHSKILHDDGYYVDWFWPMKKDEFGMDIPEADTSYFLHKVHKTIGKYNWDETKQDKERKQYIYKNTEAFQRFIINKTLDSKDLFEKSFLPKAKVILPVYDENDPWCESNKHTKVLVAKSRPWESKGKSGVSIDAYLPYNGAYQNLRDEFFLQYPPEEWTKQIAIYKDSSKKLQSYTIIEPGDPKALREYKIDLDKNPLTDDFIASLSHFDLDRNFHVKSYTYLFKVVGNGLKLVDGTTGSHFYDELVELMEKEQEEWKEKAKEAKDSQEGNSIPSHSEETSPAPAPANARQAAASRAPARQGNSIEDQYKKIFKSWDVLTDAEKKIQLETTKSFDGGKPVAINVADWAPCEDTNCKHADGTIVESHNTLSHCPMCGMQFQGNG